MDLESDGLYLYLGSVTSQLYDFGEIEVKELASLSLNFCVVKSGQYYLPSTVYREGQV